MSDLRLLSSADAAQYDYLVTATAADLAARGKQEHLYFHTAEVRDRALAEGRIIGRFIDNILVGAVTFEQGDIAQILEQRFPDVVDVPQQLGHGVYTSNGMVLPDDRCEGVLTSMMQWIVDAHPGLQVTGTMHHRNIAPQRVHAAIGSHPVAVLHSPVRPDMVLCARPAHADAARVA